MLICNECYLFVFRIGEQIAQTDTVSELWTKPPGRELYRSYSVRVPYERGRVRQTVAGRHRSERRLGRVRSAADAQADGVWPEHRHADPAVYVQARRHCAQLVFRQHHRRYDRGNVRRRIRVYTGFGRLRFSGVQLGDQHVLESEAPLFLLRPAER